MPHIDNESKRALNKLGRSLCWGTNPGEKVYQAYMQLVDMLPTEPRFADFFNVILRAQDAHAMCTSEQDRMAWRLALREFCRLKLDPYEDGAIERNGRAEWPPPQRIIKTKRGKNGGKR